MNFIQKLLQRFKAWRLDREFRKIPPAFRARLQRDGWKLSPDSTPHQLVFHNPDPRWPQKISLE